jgi:acetyltransferase-like isoleucine patch superfamily enzyme
MQNKPKMRTNTTKIIDHTQSIRHKLYDNEVSNWKRYALLVTGDTSILKLIKYEIIVLLFGSLPGALGLKLRQLFYPKLFKEVGRDIVFGRNLVIRNAKNIKIGDRVVIDDQTLIDARGAGNDGIIIGTETVLNRDVMVIAKVGGIHIGSNTDVGSRTMLMSTGGIRIGNKVALAGDCKIGGSAFSFEDDADGKRTVKKISKGLIQIGDQCTIFMSTIVLDGVHIDRGSVIGPNIVLRDNVDENTVVTAHQKLVNLPISSVYSTEQHKTVAPTPEVENMENTEEIKVPSTEEATAVDPVFQQAIVNSVYAAVDELNLLRSSDNQLVKQLDTDLSELSSIDLVNLIVETEQQIQESLGISVDLTRETTSEGRDAFRNLNSFVREIQVILQDKTE